MPINNKSPISRSFNFVKRTGDNLFGNLIADNNIGLQGKETGGTARSLIKLDTSDRLQIGNSVTTNIAPNGLRMSINNKSLEGIETGSTARNLIKMNASNQVEIGSTSNQILLPNTTVLPNNKFLFGQETGGANVVLVGVNTGNSVQWGNTTSTNRVLNQMRFSNDRGIEGLTVAAAIRSLIKMNTSDQAELGSSTNKTIVRSSANVELTDNFDYETTGAGKGIVVKTPDGTKRYRIAVDNAGAVTTTLL